MCQLLLPFKLKQYFGNNFTPVNGEVKVDEHSDDSRVVLIIGCSMFQVDFL